MVSQGERITWTRWYEPSEEPNGGTKENYAFLTPLEYGNGSPIKFPNLRDHWNDASAEESSDNNDSTAEINVLCVRERKRGINLI